MLYHEGVKLVKDVGARQLTSRSEDRGGAQHLRDRIQMLRHEGRMSAQSVDFVEVIAKNGDLETNGRRLTNSGCVPQRR